MFLILFFFRPYVFQEVDPSIESSNVEDVDLRATDYFQIWVGDDQSVCDAGIEARNRDGAIEVVDYQDRLTWNERLLDDFS
jgi:hypothetical protein